MPDIFLWILGGIIFGILFFNIIPKVLVRTFNLIYQTKYSNYFVQKMIYEQIKEGKTLLEVNEFINKNIKGVKNGN